VASFLDVCRFTPTLGGTTDWVYSTAVTGYQGPAAAGAVNGAVYRYRAESADLTQWEIGYGAYTSGSTTFARTTVLFNSLGTTAKVNFSTVPQVAVVCLAEDLVFTTPPQGRLSLTAGVALTQSDVTGATVVRFVPYGGNYVPINSVPTLFAELTNDSTQSSTGSAGPAVTLVNSVYDYYVWNPGSGPVLTRSPPWTTTATVTMTIASPCVVTWAGSDFDDGVPFLPTTTGALPTGLTAGTQYYIKRTGAAGTVTPTFNLSATVGGAAINTSGSQSGTHTGLASSDLTQGTGAGTAQRTTNADGTIRNTVAITNGPGAGLGTLVGSARTNASNQFTDSVLFRWVSNLYNKEPRLMSVIDTGANFVYSTATYQIMNANVANKLDYLQCIGGNVLTADSHCSYQNTGAGGNYGFNPIQIDVIQGTGIVSGNRNSWSFTAVANQPVGVDNFYSGAQSMGRHRGYWTQINAGGGTATWVLSNSVGFQAGATGSILN
jgi:hypothetical protein